MLGTSPSPTRPSSSPVHQRITRGGSDLPYQEPTTRGKKRSYHTPSRRRKVIKAKTRKHNIASRSSSPSLASLGRDTNHSTFIFFKIRSISNLSITRPRAPGNGNHSPPPLDQGLNWTCPVPHGELDRKTVPIFATRYGEGNCKNANGTFDKQTESCCDRKTQCSTRSRSPWALRSHNRLPVILRRQGYPFQSVEFLGSSCLR